MDIKYLKDAHIANDNSFGLSMKAEFSEIRVSQVFKMTDAHLQLSRKIRWQAAKIQNDYHQEMFFPIPGVYRPFGNSSPLQDIAEALGCDFDESVDFDADGYFSYKPEILAKLIQFSKEIPLALQCIMDTMGFESGIYFQQSPGLNWINWRSAEKVYPGIHVMLDSLWEEARYITERREAGDPEWAYPDPPPGSLEAAIMGK